MPASIDLPPGWGDDELSSKQEDSFGNLLATFHNKPAARNELIQIDKLFLRAVEAVKHLNDKRLPQALFLIRSHSSFRAAATLAMMGHVAEAPAVQRQCLEWALYAYRCHATLNAAEAWVKRHESSESLKKCKNLFGIRAIKAVLEADAPKLAVSFDAIYQRTIDFGAHPNERALLFSGKFVDTDIGVEIQQIYHHGDGEPLDHALSMAMQSGVVSLLLFRLMFVDRFSLTGMGEDLSHISSKFIL